MTKYCVLFLVGGCEHRSPWYFTHQRAEAALAIIKRRHGDKATIYID